MNWFIENGIHQKIGYKLNKGLVVKKADNKITDVSCNLIEDREDRMVDRHDDKWGII